MCFWFQRHCMKQPMLILIFPLKLYTFSIRKPLQSLFWLNVDLSVQRDQLLFVQCANDRENNTRNRNWKYFYASEDWALSIEHRRHSRQTEIAISVIATLIMSHNDNIFLSLQFLFYSIVQHSTLFLSVCLICVFMCKCIVHVWILLF